MADISTAQIKTFREQFPWTTGDGVLLNLRALMSVLDNTLLPLLASKADYDAATQETRNIILTRFNEQIQPIFDSITSAASLGALFQTRSASVVTVGLGLKSFVIEPDDRLIFAAAAYVAVVSSGNPRDAMLGPVKFFDRDTGTLTIEAESISGTNEIRNDWLISPSPPPYVPVGFNAGSYDSAPPSDATPYVSMPSGASGGASGGTY